MRRMMLTAMMGLMLTAASVYAADTETAPGLTPAVTAVATSLAPRIEFTPTPKLPAQYHARPRPAVLPALYVGAALLQGYDAYSTLAVLQHGGAELNPMVQMLTKSPAAFIGLKAGMT